MFENINSRVEETFDVLSPPLNLISFFYSEKGILEVDWYRI